MLRPLVYGLSWPSSGTVRGTRATAEGISIRIRKEAMNDDFQRVVHLSPNCVRGNSLFWYFIAVSVNETNTQSR